jgi:hypothetical protein
MARTKQALGAVGLLVLGGLLGAGIVHLVEEDGTGESAAYAETCANLDRIRAGVVDTPDIIVFYKPDVDEPAILRVRDRLDGDARVETLTYLDHEQAYAEFTRLFADKPDLLKSITAAVLPPSLRIEVRPATDVPAFVRELQAGAGVYDVKTQSSLTIELQGATMASLLWNAPTALRADARAIVDNVAHVDEPGAADKIDAAIAQLAGACAGR